MYGESYVTEVVGQAITGRPMGVLHVSGFEDIGVEHQNPNPILHLDDSTALIPIDVFFIPFYSKII